VDADAKVRLSGYGVELAIKSTEYKAKDDVVITGNLLSSVQSYLISAFNALTLLVGQQEGHPADCQSLLCKLYTGAEFLSFFSVVYVNK